MKSASSWKPPRTVQAGNVLPFSCPYARVAETVFGPGAGNPRQPWLGLSPVTAPPGRPVNCCLLLAWSLELQIIAPEDC